jgi:hypothetical protein
MAEESCDGGREDGRVWEVGARLEDVDDGIIAELRH